MLLQGEMEKYRELRNTRVRARRRTQSRYCIDLRLIIMLAYFESRRKIAAELCWEIRGLFGGHNRSTAGDAVRGLLNKADSVQC